MQEVPKIHCENPTSSDHSIRFRDNELTIPLSLNGIFSFFHTRKPLDDELQSQDKLFITPDQSSWNPYCSSFELNERSMLDYEGEVTNPSCYTHYPQDMGDEDFYAASVTLADHDATLDTVADTAFAPEQAENEKYNNDSVFLEKLEIRAEIFKMMGSL